MTIDYKVGFVYSINLVYWYDVEVLTKCVFVFYGVSFSKIIFKKVLPVVSLDVVYLKICFYYYDNFNQNYTYASFYYPFDKFYEVYYAK